MSRWKLNLDREVLDEIGKKHNIKIIQICQNLKN